MKVRNGFVSNSSSSSFIVIFPKIPKNSEDVKNILFTKGETLYGAYGELYSTDKVSETVWNDIKEQKINDFNSALEILENCSNYDFPDAPSYNDFNDIEDNHERWEKRHNASIIFAKKKLKSFFNIRKLKFKKLNKEVVEDACFYTFQYSDESEYFSALEHGGLFKNLKHLTVNNH